MLIRRKTKRFFYSLSTGLFFVVSVFSLLFSVTHGAKAKFDQSRAIASIEINGMDYGRFPSISDVSDLKIEPRQSEDFSRVHLNRDFVTSPSLYLWARNNYESQEGLKNVELVIRADDGQELKRYVLKMCKPLSWSVEVAEPQSGGFHEKIELAVQQITTL